MKKGLFIYLITSAICLANVNVDTMQKSNKSEKYTYNFQYPKVTFKGKEIALNKEVENIVNQNINGLVKDSQKNPYKDMPYEGESIYKEYKNNFGVTSILDMTYIYTGGNHGTTGLMAYNISNSTGKVLTFNDIFKPGTKKFIEREIIKAIKNNVKTLGDKSPYFKGMSTRTTDIDNAVFFFRGNDLVVRYQEYAIAPHSSGTPEFEFSKEMLKDYLKI